MYYLILIIILAIFVLISYRLFNKDFLAPSFIVSVTYLASVSAAYIAKLFNMWNYVDLGLKTTSIVALGVLAFIVGEYITRLIMKKIKRTYKINKEKNTERDEIIKISNIKIVIIYFFLIITFLTIYIQMIQITGITNDIPRMINEYRNLTPLFNNTEKATSINTVAMQMYRASVLFAYIFIYIIINNILLKDKIKNNIKYFIPIVIIAITSFFIAGRTDFIRMVVAALFLGIMLYKKVYPKRLKIKNLLTIGIVAVIIILPLFYIIMPLIGRNQVDNFWDYITFYIGSPVPSLNEIIARNEVGNSQHFGQETFKGIQGILSRFNLIDYYEPYQRQWISFNGLSSNIFTGLKTYYSDFGISGVILLQIMFSSLVSMLYMVAKHKKNKVYLIFYIFSCSYMILDQYRLEKLFSSFLSIDTIIYTVYLLIILFYMFKNKDDLKEIIKGGKEIINGRRITK